MTRMESGNGYDLLWQILALTVLGFNPTIPVTIPAWQDDDIFFFATSFTLYFRIQAKKGVVSDNPTHSTTFLNAILEPTYTNVITTLLTCINNYYSTYDEGYLPLHLCVMGLAAQLHKTAGKRASALVPRIGRTAGLDGGWAYDVPIQGSPRIARLDAGNHDRPPPRDGRGNRELFSPRPPQYRPYVQGGRGGGRPPPNVPQRGQYARPDHNKSKWDPTVICDACRRTGHEAATCDMLAMAIFLEKYKRDMPEDMKDKVELAWLKRWKGSLGNPSRKPRRVMKAYLDLLDTSLDEVDEQMCWECWPNNDDETIVADE
jgi:hypothetical protein